MSGRGRRLAALESHVAALERPGPERRRGPTPYPGTILDAMADAGMVGASWSSWRTFWRGVFALPFEEPGELALFQERTGRTRPPTAPVREVFQIIGRRGGKTRNAALCALWLGCRENYHASLAPGERALIVAIGADRGQAGQVLGYLKGFCASSAFHPFVRRTLTESIELTTGATVEVRSASFRTTRGFTLAGIIADELGFWRVEDGSANPDSEIFQALKPGLATISGSLFCALSTPYRRQGELFKAWERHYGKDEADTLIWVAPSLVMNPTLSPDVVQRAYQDDEIAARSEFGAEWRADLEPYISLEALQAVTVPGRLELAPFTPGPARDADPRRPVLPPSYVGFVDMSGGSSDSSALAVAHHEPRTGRAVLDLVREARAPHAPDRIASEFVVELQRYDVRQVYGDRYGAEWVAQAFRTRGMDYRSSERSKSDLYRELLPICNSGDAEMLDLPRLRAQLLGLERRVARGGRDSIDHGPGGHDDLANAVAGALVFAADRASELPGGFWFNW